MTDAVTWLLVNLVLPAIIGGCIGWGFTSLAIRRRRWPKRIRDARIVLRTGDEITVTAFRRCRDEEGLMLYQLAYPDGSPLTIRQSDVAGLHMPVLPGRSSVALYLTGP